MNCCAPADLIAEQGRVAAREELRLNSRDLGDGLHQTDLSVPGVHCADCIRRIEQGLRQVAEVTHVRVNLSTRRVAVQWQGAEPPDLIGSLAALGFQAHLFEPGDQTRDPELGRLVRALAVAGFAAMNVMLLSVSVWAGADAGTRQIFHWISAGLALICILYSGRVFYASAWSALRHGRTNMDVPISIGISLAFGLSLYDTLHNGPHAYFDAAVTLIFFLLIGRALDHLMREKARAAVHGLMRMAPRGAMVLHEDGSREYLPVAELRPGQLIAIAAGERVPADGVVTEGRSDLDCALVTGESIPQPVTEGADLRAGTMNLTGPLTMRVTAENDASFLAEMVRLMEAAEGGRAAYRRLADRAARLYSPVVHATALLTCIGWVLATGDWHQAITTAIAVLIITCPCALGLAVPIVQVMAARRLFEKRIMVRDGSAIERMAQIDTVIFDKTGTLTRGRPELLGEARLDPQSFAIAGSMARHSRHPLSRAIAEAAPGSDLPLTDMVEHPGLGIEARQGAEIWRLGRSGWAVTGGEMAASDGTVLTRDGRICAEFTFTDELRPHARQAMAELRNSALSLAIMSGDAPEAVREVGERLQITDRAGSLLPGDKMARLEALQRDGHKVLMLGDGLNDAPALAAAHVSMAPATAADIGRNQADFVFLGDGLEAVPLAHKAAKIAGRLVRQNFGLALLYNAIALPVAIAGFVTPLVAALSMSLSSVLVVANALRLRLDPSPAPARHADMPVLQVPEVVR